MAGGQGQQHGGSGQAPRRCWRGAAAAVPAPVARRGPRSRRIRWDPSRWRLRPGPARGLPGVARTTRGGGEQPRIAGSGGRIIGVQFYQPCNLLFGVPHQPARNGSTSWPILAMAHQPVMTAGQGELARAPGTAIQTGRDRAPARRRWSGSPWAAGRRHSRQRAGNAPRVRPPRAGSGCPTRRAVCALPAAPAARWPGHGSSR